MLSSTSKSLGGRSGSSSVAEALCTSADSALSALLGASFGAAMIEASSADDEVAASPDLVTAEIGGVEADAILSARVIGSVAR